MVQQTGGSGPAHPEPLPPEPTDPIADTPQEEFQGSSHRPSEPTPASGADTVRGLPDKLVGWFKDLPSVPKLILIGLVLLLLLTVLSPVARVVAIVAFLVSAAVLCVRAIRGRPLRAWVIAIVGSAVLIPVFGGISDAVYDSEIAEDNDREGEESSYAPSDSDYTSPEVAGSTEADRREVYLKLLREESSLALEPDYMLLAKGEEACVNYEATNGNPYMVAELLLYNNSTFSSEEAIDITINSAWFLCPEYAENVNEIIEENSGDGSGY